MDHSKPDFSDTSLWFSDENRTQIQVIDQRHLPFKFEVFGIGSVEDAFFAIREMVVRGAPLIGVTAAFGMYFALKAAGRNNDRSLPAAAEYLNSSRPTAVNLFMATRRMLGVYDRIKKWEENLEILWAEAVKIRQEETDACLKIGQHGLPLIEEIFRKNPGQAVQILTHCNAGRLACIKYGTATAPVYLAHEKGIPVHVWVDETRPRNQGARLTAYELGVAGIPHTVIPDNTGGHLMQHGMVDLVLVGSDCTTRNGDVANKIGTYLKALAAHDNQIPFYAALPSSSFNWNMSDGLRDIPIEARSAEEVAYAEGWTGKSISRVRLVPKGSRTANYGFDVTPARLVTGLITDRGICPASREGIEALFPERNILACKKY